MFQNLFIYSIFEKGICIFDTPLNKLKNKMENFKFVVFKKIKYQLNSNLVNLLYCNFSVINTNYTFYIKNVGN